MGAVRVCALLIWALLMQVNCCCSTACTRRDAADGFVCVCNGQSCDSIPTLVHTAGAAAIVESGQTVGVMQQSSVAFNRSAPSGGSAHITLNTTRHYQELLGFGGAFTDAAGLNIRSLSTEAQKNLMMSYFSHTTGIKYTVGRVPMASCDFSTHQYSYDDSPGDFELANFTLTGEDLQLKIPLIQLAGELAGKPLRLFGSPWSAPAWMKTNDNMSGRGWLKGAVGDKYHKTWALYFVRFMEEYAKHNLTFWGLTVQNEPADGFIPFFPFQSMYFSAETERDFVKTDLGPTLAAHGHQDVKLMILDDQRIFLPGFAKTVLSDPDAAKYVSGVAVHWYLDAVASSSDLEETHDSFPDKFLLSSEACEELVVKLGSWARGIHYANDIIKDLNHWVVGWTDWNLALNGTGGPNWAHNYVDSPIIVNPSKDEFYKQPMYYAIGHFSAFILPGSVRIHTDLSEPFLSWDLETVSFLTPAAISGLQQDLVTTVILNKHNTAQTVVFYDPSAGYIERDVQANSIVTIQYPLRSQA
ncbi:lysosomal acid glucosylceramidase-like isoform X2 [Sycon ciliatum]|uniref:lysosomal acid glucosylceramidase-like isoform X2 n=1 Tax=Sycon ciliatum TaxID=27933 RepID=UPI0031F658CF